MAKQDQSEKDLIKDRTYIRRVAHGYELQIAPGTWLHGALLAQGQDRFIVDAARLHAGIASALGSLDSQDEANFTAAALLRLKTAGVDLDDAQLRQALAGSPYALTLLAALDADVDAALLLGSGGVDRLTGTAGDDTLAGNGGDDVLAGGAGSDTYLFSAGDGHDIVIDSAGSADTIRFGAGLTPATISFSRSGQDLVLSFEGSTDRLTIVGWGTSAANQIERFEFADGTVWDAAVLAEFVARTGPRGTAGGDALQAWDSVDDVLRGLAGDDILSGGAGNDLLYGGSGNDTLAGGSGNDDLVGGSGADVYLFQRGDGQDWIYDLGYTLDGVDPSTDTIRFGAGIAATDIVLRREGGGLVFSIAGTDDRLTVNEWASSEVNRIERVEFADGTVWLAEDVQARLAGTSYSSGATEGDDFVYGWDGFDDKLQGLGGDDYLNGGGGNNTLEGGKGNDMLDGGGGSDTYRFSRGDGMDTVYDTDFDGSEGTIVFGPGITDGDIVMARAGSDVVIRIRDSSDQITVANWGTSSGNGIERFVFADGTTWDAARLGALVAALDIGGTDGADFLVGNERDNVLIGGAGDDFLYGGFGADTYHFARGDGQDTIQDYGYDIDTIRFGAGISADQIVLSRSGNDLALAVAGSDDRITVRSWASEYSRIERVMFADGTIWDSAALAAMVSALPIVGTDGDDYLFGDGGDNTLVGGAGNDSLSGSYGSDTYVFKRGDGHDTIQEWTWYGETATDTLRFGAGIAAGDVVLRRRGADLVFEIAGGADSVTVLSWGSGRIEQVAFADGTVWNEAALLDMVAALPLLGTDGDDYLMGDENANIFDGGAGNDTMGGGGGGDTYLFGRGDGQDSIQDYGNGVDTIRFDAGISAGDIVLSRNGNDLSFGIAGSDDRITVRNWGYGDSYRIEQVVFADGTVWDAVALTAKVGSLPLLGTSGDDYLSGDDEANTFDGGAGNDILRGGAGGDTYLFARGDGQDSIDEYGYEVDTIRFGAGIIADDIILSRNGSSLVFAIAGSDDRITVGNWSNGGYYRIEQVIFANGTVWDAAALDAMVANIPFVGTDGDDYLSGDSDANTFDGGRGNDTLQGGYGTDTYLFERGDGQDQIYEAGFGEVDTIRFGTGIGAGDIVLGRSGDDLVLSIAGSGDSITVRNWKYGDFYRIEQVVFADGTIWNAAALTAMVNAIPFVGTDGDDYLAGDGYANTFDGGEGNDTLEGDYGGDTYLFARGDGQDTILEAGSDLDTIRFGAGIAAGEIVLSRSGDDLVLAIAGSDDRITVRNWKNGSSYRIEQVAFADGTVWDEAALAAMVAAIPVTGTDGDDYLGGDERANILDGGAGNDFLGGGYGADTYLFDRGDGQDIIAESGFDADTIRFGAGIVADDIVVSREGDDLVFAVAGTEDRITVRNWRYGQEYRIEQVAFADGTLWDAATITALVSVPLIGTDGDDYLSGDSDDNLLDGGAGNDTLAGGYGSDTYLFERGDGQDSIVENSYGEVDTLQFGAGIGAAEIVVVRNGYDLAFTIAGSGDRVTVRDWYYGDAYRIEQVAFSDGTVWDAAALATMASSAPVAGTDGDDVLVGAGWGNVFDGGAGNDTLQGGYGADTYLFEPGDGRDTIVEGGYNVDTIRFGAGIAAADIVVSREGSDLVFAVAGTDDRITVRNWGYGDYYRIEQVVFADGTLWDAAAINALAVAPIVGTDGDDVLYGDGDDNLLHGGAGNDVLRGDYGRDTYVFERGDGQDSIEEYGYDLDTIRFGAGIGAADIVVSREGSSLVLSIAGTDDRVTVLNWGSGDYYRIEQVEFADGTVWDAAALKTMANVPLVGTDGDDYLYGDRDDNLLAGGAGNDTLMGDAGADTYLFQLGDGQDRIEDYGYDSDTIRFGAGIAAADIVVSREGGDLVFAVAGTDDRVTVGNWGDGDYHRIEQVAFADGTVWDGATLRDLANLPFIGTDGDDYLTGDSDDNVFDGGAGNDTLQGNGGADTYLFERGDGQDYLYEFGYESDTIRFGAGIAATDIVMSREGSNLVFALAGTEDRITVADWQYSPYYRIERIEFADGSAWDAEQIDSMVAGLPIAGTEWDDNLYGDDGDNILAGGAGNDYLNGGAGGDTYLFARGDGQDRVLDYGYDSERPDVIRFGEGIDEADVSVGYAGSSLVFSLNDSGEGIEVFNWQYGAEYRIERVEFADGSSWDAAAIEARIAPADAGLGAWALSSSLLAFSLESGNEAVLGGETGTGYGAGQLPADSAQALLAGTEFDKTRQAV